MMGHQLATEVSCYDSDYYFSNDIHASDYELHRDAWNYFKSHGYKVSFKAIAHCLKGWHTHSSSAYRDEPNGIHLINLGESDFFALRLSTLHPLCEEWQQTYGTFV
jgi:hypothetical protein